MRIKQITIWLLLICSSYVVLVAEQRFERAKQYYDNAVYDSAAIELNYILNNTNYKDVKARCYNNLGLIYYELNNYEEAEKYYKLGLNCNSKNKYYKLLLENIANLYYSSNKYPEANKYYIEALKYSITNKDYNGIVTAKYNLANIYHCLGRYDLAMEYYQNALYDYHKYMLNDDELLVNNIVAIASMYAIKNDTAKAIRILNIANKYNITDKYPIYSHLFLYSMNETKYIDSILKYCDTEEKQIEVIKLLVFKNMDIHNKYNISKIQSLIDYAINTNNFNEAKELLAILNKAPKKQNILTNYILTKYSSLIIIQDSTNKLLNAKLIWSNNRINQTMNDNPKLNNNIVDYKFYIFLIITLFIFLVIIYFLIVSYNIKQKRKNEEI